MHSLLGRNVSCFQMRLPVQIREVIAPFLDRLGEISELARRDGVKFISHLHLLWRPCIKIHGLDLADVRAHSAVDSRASDAQKDATNIL